MVHARTQETFYGAAGQPNSTITRKTKVYISGKITGLDDLNKPKFDAAEDLLNNLGYDVLNPHSIVPKTKGSEKPTWKDYMIADIKEMVSCDAVAVLDDWYLSKGAIAEVTLAMNLGIPVVQVETMELLKFDIMLNYKQ